MWQDWMNRRCSGRPAGAKLCGTLAEELELSIREPLSFLLGRDMLAFKEGKSTAVGKKT